MTRPTGDGARAVGDTGRTEDRANKVIDHDDPTTRHDGSQHDGRQHGGVLREGEVEQRVSVKPAKTSPVAVFSLVFGLSALICVLTVLLSPVGLVLSLIGLVLGFIALKTTKKVGVTGRGVARGGLILSALALVLSIVLAVGAVTFLNNDTAVNRLQDQVNQLKDKLPTQVDIPQP